MTPDLKCEYSRYWTYSGNIVKSNVEQYIKVAKLILAAGNKLLIVSKPNIHCSLKLVSALAKYREQILFRFTIGTTDPKVSKFWEPGAPLPGERIRCLTIAQNDGFNTSVSIEPMLEGSEGAKRVISAVLPYVTEDIWVGKMNRVNLRVVKSSPEIMKAVDYIGELQGDWAIKMLYEWYKDNPVIKWKDSIKQVVGVV